MKEWQTVASPLQHPARNLKHQGLALHFSSKCSIQTCFAVTVLLQRFTYMPQTPHVASEFVAARAVARLHVALLAGDQACVPAVHAHLAAAVLGSYT